MHRKFSGSFPDLFLFANLKLKQIKHIMITIIAIIYIFFILWLINSWKLLSENPQASSENPLLPFSSPPPPPPPPSPDENLKIAQH